jgi:hypothetical protein
VIFPVLNEVQDTGHTERHEQADVCGIQRHRTDDQAVVASAKPYV